MRITLSLQTSYVKQSAGATMTEIDVDGWSIEQDREDSITLTSAKGEVSANRSSQEDHMEVWYVEATLVEGEPKSWKVTVENRQELVGHRLPNILQSLTTQS